MQNFLLKNKQLSNCNVNKELYILKKLRYIHHGITMYFKHLDSESQYFYLERIALN